MIAFTQNNILKAVFYIHIHTFVPVNALQKGRFIGTASMLSSALVISINSTPISTTKKNCIT